MVQATHRKLTVSVIIPAFNSQATIRRAIDSVLAQSILPEEIIVMDDGSDEDLRPALSRYVQSVRCIRQPNAGAAAARNAGIDLANGDWIAFLDADDHWEPAKLQLQLRTLEQHPKIDLIASRYFTQNPSSPARTIQPCEHRWLDRELRARGEEVLDLASAIWTGTVLVRRDALRDERFVSGLEPAEDRDLWIRIVARHAAYVLHDPLATAVLVPDSLSRRDADSGYEPMIRVLARHRNLLDARTMRTLEARVYRAWAAAHLGARKPRRAIAPAMQRLRREPFHPQAWWIVAKSAAGALVRNDRPIRSADGRNEAALRRHFEIERGLADRLRIASASQRRSLYGQAYDELFGSVPDHPQNTRKTSAASQERSLQWQWRLLKHFVRRESRYLEIGAGDCHLTMSIARRARRAYGVDVSNVIAAANNQPENFSLIISDGVNIDVPRGSIDVAYSNQLMEHLHPDDAAAQLAQVYRSLAGRGCYICLTPHRFSGPHDVSKFFADEACGFHLKEYTYAELRALFLGAGFEATQVWTGLKGRYFRLPQWIVLTIERAVGALPRSVGQMLCRSPLLRPVFFNVLLVGRAAAHAMPESTPATVQT